MTTLAITITHRADPTLYRKDSATGINGIALLLSGLAAGARPGTISVNVESGFYSKSHTYSTGGTLVTSTFSLNLPQSKETLKDMLDMPGKSAFAAQLLTLIMGAGSGAADSSVVASYSGGAFTATYGSGAAARSKPHFPTASLAATNLYNHWRSEDLVVTPGSALWTDNANAFNLTKAFSNDPEFGVEIDGHKTLNAYGLKAMENATTTMAASTARETWVVVRYADNGALQMLFDGLSGSNRHTCYANTDNDMSVNNGSTLTGNAQADWRGKDVHLIRIAQDGAGNTDVYVITDTASSLTTPVFTGTGGTGQWAGITLGASNSGSSAWLGDIGEVARYSAELSAGDAVTTASYFLNKFPSIAKRALPIAWVSTFGNSIVADTTVTENRGYSLMHKFLERCEETEPVSGKTVHFQGQVARHVFPHDGVSGNTLSQITARINASIVANNTPDLIILEGGINDCQDAGYDQATAMSDLTAALAQCHTSAPNVPVLFIGPTALNNTTHNDNVTAFNAGVAAVAAAASQSVTVVDVSGFVPGTMRDGDGVHWNDVGNDYFGELVHTAAAAAV